MATDNQLSYLRSLVRGRALLGVEVSPQETTAKVEERIAAGMTFEETSALIDRAKAARFYPTTAVPASARALASLREAAVEKAVYGLAFTPEETVAKVEAAIGAGLSMHDAQILLRTAWAARPHPTAKQALPLSLVEGIDGLSVSEGHFAVFVEDVLRFYRVYRPDTGEYTGQPVIRRFASENLLGLYPTEARDALQAISADHDAAAFRFADEYTRCWACGKVLTDAVSRLLSVGPTCRGFAGHSGLKASAAAVDHDPARRAVYRALREWAQAQGFRDPRNKPERDQMAGQVTASRVAAAWSGLPGILTRTPEEVTALVSAALSGNMDEDMTAMLLAAPADTLLVLTDSGVLTGPVISLLAEKHSSPKVRGAAAEAFLGILTV